MKDSPETAVQCRCPWVLAGYCVLLWFSLPLGISRGAEPNRQDPVRIGIVEPIDGSGIPLGRIDELRQRLIRVDGSAGYGNRIRLIRCTDEQVDTKQNSVVGACGRSVSVPAKWIDSESVTLYRGVILGPWRPSQRARQDRVRQWQQNNTTSEDQPPPQFAAEDLPSDVLLCKTETGLSLGCDWNADLVIAEEEILRLGSKGLQRHTIATTAEAAVLVRPVKVASATDERAEATPETLEIELWTPTSQTASRQDGLAATVLNATGSREVQLVWIDCGQQADPSANDAIGPADWAVAFDAAAKHNCDFIAVDLRRSKMEPTQTAKLLARLSLSSEIPAVVNQPTLVSPQYLIDPELQSTPDLAAAVFDLPRDDGAFALAIDRMIQRVQNQPAAGTRENSLRTEQRRDVIDNAIETILLESNGDDRQSSIAHDLLVGRVPTDAITGSPRVSNSNLVDLDHHQTARFYDPVGRLVTNPLARAGGSVANLPLIEAARSSGGLVTLQQHELVRINGREADEETQNIGFDFVRGREPVLQLRADSSDPLRRLRLIGQTELSHNLDVEILSYLRSLVPCEDDEVPQAVLASAGGLRGRSPRVQSWWYRSDPWPRSDARPGSNSGQFVVQDHTGASPLYDNDQLQLWRFWNQGTPSGDSDMLGEVGPAKDWVQWVLVEAVMLDAQHAPPAPVLIQCFPHHRSRTDQAAEFKRIAHQASKRAGAKEISGAVTKAGETDGYETEWVDDYEGKLHLGHDRLLAHADWIWAGLYESGPTRRLVRWLKIGRPEIHLAHSTPHRLRSERPLWWPHFRDDVVAGEVMQRRNLGQSPQTVLEHVSAEIPANTEDVLNLRRLLLSLDQPEIRKQHLDRVISVADRVVSECRQILGGLPRPVDPAVQGMLNSVEAAGGATAFGSSVPDLEPPPDPFRLSGDPASLQAYAWAVDAMYRKVRAIGYRELPDVLVENPIADQQAQDEAFERAYFQLAGMVDLDHPDFVLVRVRRQRRAGHPADAYEHLQKYAAFDEDPYWYFKKARDLWDDLELGLPQRLGHARWFLRQLGSPLPTQ